MKTFTRHTVKQFQILVILTFVIPISVSNASTDLQSTTHHSEDKTAEIKKYLPGISNDQVIQLLTDGKLKKPFAGNQDTTPWPNLNSNPTSSAYLAASVKANIHIEEIFYFPASNLYIPENAKPDHPQLVKLYNALSKVSTLKGLHYYSASRKKMRVLFKEAYRVESESHPVKNIDPIVDRVPSLSELVVFQHDLTFGKNYTKATYRNTGGLTTLTLTNLNDLRYGFIPFIRRNKLQTKLTFIPVSQGVLAYCEMHVGTIKVFGLENMKLNSFENRLDALAGWTKENIKKISF